MLHTALIVIAISDSQEYLVWENYSIIMRFLTMHRGQP